ncbi:hypothetical protein GO986_17830 [Deinococcus sp. HMF7620]|uniref:Uncharacterized protein n=1 Tax=Deinococcus arboris TaxID=2682977 RepID=A0A7C9MAY7_9DEIO|nr:hypothetical protein [Deinococcus arboris]MVN88599.1 hypothetical protein [Deinococcus arboris]
MYLYGLAALAVLLGVVIVAVQTRNGRATPEQRVLGLVGGILVALLGTGLSLVAQKAVTSEQAQAERQAARDHDAAVAESSSFFGTSPTPTASAPAAPSPASTRTDAQNLAIVAGRDPNDSEIAQKLARLDAACPDENASAGDMVVSVRRIVREQSGRDLDIVNVLDQFITAQEGGAQAGMKCSETGGMLAELMVKGM